MQFNGKTDENGYLTDVSTNQQEGFTEYTIQDKYAPFLSQYYDKMRVINGIVSVPDNLPITQFEQEKADWEAQISQDKQNINEQLTQVTKEVTTMQSKIDEANNASKALDDKIKTANDATNKMIGQVQMQLTKEFLALKASLSTSNGTETK